MMRGFALCGLSAVLLVAAASATALDRRAIDYGAERAAIEEFQELDQRLQDVGWKLARSNADFCQETAPSIGLQLQDMASYGSPDIARKALGLIQDFAVQTAAQGSPSALSGAFWRNREIVEADGANMSEWPASERLDWRRLVRAHDALDTGLTSNGEVTFRFSDASKETVKPVTVCRTRFELSGEGERAVADGKRVVIGSRFYGFTYSEELFAAAVAHELAHNLLRHRDWLDQNGRKRRNVRTTEREADKLMPWLLANAGYDPAAAGRFFREYQPSSGGGFLLRGSHDNWEKRAKVVEAEVPRIHSLMKREGRADWSGHFARMIEPENAR
ncbi:hypothetical protein [Erythrobacter crassostreae]|uniref:Peptidase M48 family protein n=1 Tax=Erythrobacter crassostreae TaxID=2828328 RepID=A0A9X1F3H8_9SPHN|nr:hypothetical protein [Erythrobacter crassostrea]MBV7258648.1 hypothetical protein [Erythrobacter crassostrea]